MKERIIELLKQEDSKKVNIEELAAFLRLSSSEDFKEMMKTVNQLIEEAVVIENKRHEITLIENTDFIVGHLDLKDKGFGFVIPLDDSADDVFIPKQEMNGAMNKDKVLVFLTKHRSGFRREGQIRRVVERKYTYILGTISYRNGMGLLISDDRTIKQEIVIKKENLNGAQKNDKVQAKIVDYDFKGRIECIVSNILGNKNDAGIDILSKIIKYNVDPFFSEDVLKEANKFTNLRAEDYKDRRDLRDEKIITIDGDDAKDFDDAVIVKKLPNGNYHLGVHIADVSHYVKDGSLLDN